VLFIVTLGGGGKKLVTRDFDVVWGEKTSDSTLDTFRPGAFSDAGANGQPSTAPLSPPHQLPQIGQARPPLRSRRVSLVS
jgi:hypothetical protein